MRVASAKIDELVNAVSELVTMQAQFSLIATKKNDATLMAVAEQMEKITRQLRDNSFEISLIPLQGELVRFQRLVRDLSKNLGKQIDFVVEGGEIELDKNIIEHLTDPLLHMIRNSCDHGIEMPDERISKGKNPKGTIKLKAFYSGSSVIIRVSDDGKGMDPDKLFKKAVEKGLVDANAKMSKRDILALIFASGFSTADKVSDVSGRGVGMDVVKSKIAEIRGDIAIDSEIDEGTTFTLDLPLTLSIIDGLLTKVNGEQFVVPLSNIERILSISEVQMSDSKLGKTFLYENERVMFVDLNDMFYQKEVDITKSKILLVNHGGKRVGLVVDMIVGEFQIVVKPLGKFMRKVDMISGASVMGDGSLSLIIDTTRLINAYNQQRYKK
jgi:two-component system chemotaxis sensor kinase CheA